MGSSLTCPIRDFSSPQCQPNQTYCTAGESLLTWCAGLWARAQACHWNRKKKVNYLEQRVCSIELTSRRKRALDKMNTKCKQSSLSAAGQLYASKPLLQVVYFFWRFQWQAWALAHSPAHHVNKLSPAVQYVWFGWHWGLERSLRAPTPLPPLCVAYSKYSQI